MRMHDKSVILTKAELKVLLTFASRDETRQNLYCICVDWANGRCAATDGHRLAVLSGHKKNKTDSSALLPRAAVTGALRALKKAQREAKFTPSDDGWEVCVYDFDGEVAFDSDCCMSRMRFPLLDPELRFPPIEQFLNVYKDIKHENWIRLNATYLEDLRLIATAAGETGVKLRLYSELDPIRFECGSWRGVIMPMKL